MVGDEVMLTTEDNPFNPFTQYEEWNDFDESQGYYTNAYLARVANLAESLSDEETNYELNNAIDEILKMNVLGIYKKVTPEDYFEAGGG